MNQAVIPVHIAAGRPGRRLTLNVKFRELRRLARVFDLVAGVIRRSDEDDVVRRYEGHSWCDSTERSMNYDIMSGRHLRL
jgi:hypothetical protein